MAFDKAKVLRAAEKSLAQGRIPSAIQEYQRIVEADPSDFNALNTLGDLYNRIDKKEEAVACYRRVAEHYRGQGFALKAIAMYKKLTRFSPQDYELAMTLASLYEHQGLTTDARAQYLTAADAQMHAGKPREALEVMRRIADLDPSNTDIRLRLAQSYVKEKMPEPAADAYIAAGERLAARGDHEQALEAYTSALSLRPNSHDALHGMIAAHSVLGTADEAAEVLEELAAAAPGDLELRAMLARAYVEAENAPGAERAVEYLVVCESSNYTMFFDVARLYLQQGNQDQCTHLLRRIVELAPTGKPDEQLVELLQEVLARDPEQMDALHLLVRIYDWQRDDMRLRTALERLADASETAGATDVERRALAHLVRLVPDEARYASRLEALGGPLPGDEPASQGTGSDEFEVPTFESFMLNDESFTASSPSAGGKGAPPATEFEWNTHEPAETPSIASSFADFDDFTDAASASSVTPEHAAPVQAASQNFQDVDFAAGIGERGDGAGNLRAEQSLKHDLESVDFYIAQGYTDTARDTLDMLEQQYGTHAEIVARRKRLSSDSADAPAIEDDGDAAPAGGFDFSDIPGFDLDADAPQSPAPALTGGREAAGSESVGIEFEAPPAASSPATSAQPAKTGGARVAGGIDPGLAAIFDEFREAVEDTEDTSEADYETHFNMGIAYREMGLHDQAIEELQIAIDVSAPGDGTSRYLQCCNLLGHCFTEKGVPQSAVMWFRKGLGAPGHTKDEYQALRYELGAAYEQMGDLEHAIETFTEVYSIDVSYRGVAERLRELEKKRLEVRG
ncbi:MAG: tetratricopeptide repeat protein [Acidobacteria bacterium]|nr:tetratricopeptide repeat protein [Acidobacteriota bacterium]